MNNIAFEPDLASKVSTAVVFSSTEISPAASVSKSANSALKMTPPLK